MQIIPSSTIFNIYNIIRLIFLEECCKSGICTHIQIERNQFCFYFIWKSNFLPFYAVKYKAVHYGENFNFRVLINYFWTFWFYWWGFFYQYYIHAQKVGASATKSDFLRKVPDPLQRFVNAGNYVKSIYVHIGKHIHGFWAYRGMFGNPQNPDIYTRWNSKVAGIYKKTKKSVFFCKHFIGLRNSPLRTEYNDLHDQKDYRMTSLDHLSVWRWVWRSKPFE